MKGTLKWMTFMLVISLLPAVANAQTGSTTTKTTTSKKSTAPVSHKQITIMLKNNAEKDVTVFIGPKAEIRNPKPRLKPLGGLSKNTVYVKVSDVVCIMNAQNKPGSCTDIKPTTATVEINSSATVISGK